MTNVSCPEPECEGRVSGSVVKMLVAEELFQRYDRTMLDFAIR